MRRLVSCSACLLLAAGVAGAQRGGMGGRAGFGGGVPRGGFSGGLNRGFGGGFGGSRFTVGPNFGRAGGFEHHRFFSNFRTFGRFGRFGFNNFGFGFPLAYYPLFWWGDTGMYYPYDSYYGGYSPYAQPNVTVVYPEQPVAPQVIYTQPVATATAHPVMRYCCEEPRAATSSAAPTTSERSPLYLIALRDGVIRAALAYWVEAGSLHYLGTDHVKHEVKLGEVDRAFSEQLNRERRVPFHLEP